jgi:hypothetical protein
MTSYIKLSTGEYPRYEGDIRLEHPEITEEQTYPNFPCPSTYASVEMDPTPVYDPTTHFTEPLYPEQINGVWRVRWSPLRPLTPTELAENQRKLELFKASQKAAGSSLYKNLDAAGSAPDVIG